MKKRFAVIKNEKGLTLVELLAVLVIFAIIIAIAIPAIGKYEMEIELDIFPSYLIQRKEQE